MGLMWRTSRGVAMRLFFLSVALNVFDVVTELVGLHGNWMGVRFALGLLLGATGALLVSSAVREFEFAGKRAAS